MTQDSFSIKDDTRVIQLNKKKEKGKENSVAKEPDHGRGNMGRRPSEKEAKSLTQKKEKRAYQPSEICIPPQSGRGFAPRRIGKEEKKKKVEARTHTPATFKKRKRACFWEAAQARKNKSSANQLQRKE